MFNVPRLLTASAWKPSAKVYRRIQASALAALLLSAPAGAITFSHPEVYNPDPMVEADVVSAPWVDASGNHNFVLRDPITGHHDHFQINPAQFNWSVVGTDGAVLGGSIPIAKRSPEPPSTQCTTPLLLGLCGLAGALMIRGIVCEMRTNGRIHRATRACSAAGHGTEVTQQRGCSNVTTRCIITGRPVQVQ